MRPDGSDGQAGKPATVVGVSGRTNVGAGATVVVGTAAGGAETAVGVWPGTVVAPADGVVVAGVVVGVPGNVVGVPGASVVVGVSVAAGSLPGQASAGAIFDEITRSGVTPSET